MTIVAFNNVHRAYTKGTDFKPATRLPAERFVHWETW